MIYWGAGSSYFDHFLSALPEETERGYYALLGWLAAGLLLTYVGLVAGYEAAYDLFATRVEAEIVGVKPLDGADSDRIAVSFRFADAEGASVIGRDEISLSIYDGPEPAAGGTIAVEYFAGVDDSLRAVSGWRRGEVWLFWAAAAVGGALLGVLIVYANREVNRPFKGPPPFMR